MADADELLSDTIDGAQDVMEDACAVAAGHAPEPGDAFIAPSATVSRDVGILKERLAEAVTAVREAESARPRRSGRSRRGAGATDDASSRVKMAQSAVTALELLAQANAGLTDCDGALRRGALDRAVTAISKSETAIASLAGMVGREASGERPSAESAKANRALEALTQAASTKRVRVAHAAASLWMQCLRVAHGPAGRAVMDTTRASDVDTSSLASLDTEPADADSTWLDALKSGVAAAVHVHVPLRDGLPQSPSTPLGLLLSLSPHTARAAVSASASALASVALAPALTGQCGLVPVLLPLARRQRGERLVAVVNPPSQVASIVAGTIDAPDSTHDSLDSVAEATAAVSRVSRTVVTLFTAIGLSSSPSHSHGTTVVSQARTAVDACRSSAGGVDSGAQAASAGAATHSAAARTALDAAENACIRHLAACLLLARVWWGESLDEAGAAQLWVTAPWGAKHKMNHTSSTLDHAPAATVLVAAGEDDAHSDQPRPVHWIGLAPTPDELELAAGDAMDAHDAMDAVASGCGLALSLSRLLADAAPVRIDSAEALADAATRAGKLEGWVLAQLQQGSAAAKAIGQIRSVRGQMQPIPSHGQLGEDEEHHRQQQLEEEEAEEDDDEEEEESKQEYDEWCPAPMLAALGSDLPHHTAVARRRSVLARARNICVGSGFAAAVSVSESSTDLAPGTISAAVGAEAASAPGKAALEAAGQAAAGSSIAAADASVVAVTSDGDWVDDGWGTSWDETSPQDAPVPPASAVDDAAIAAADAAPGHEAADAAAAAASAADSVDTATAGISTASAAASALLSHGSSGAGADLSSQSSLAARVQHARMASALRSRAARVLPAPFFRLAHCQVSRAAIDLVALVRTTMEEATQLADPTSDGAGFAPLPEAAVERAAAVLYHAARDALSLYRAVVPAAFGSEIASNARVAALVHNDCLFLAHHATTLGHTFRQALPGDLSRTASFADLVVPLRDLAERTLLHQIRAQRNAVGALLRMPVGSDIPRGLREAIAEPVGPGQTRSTLLMQVDACATATTTQLDAVLERPTKAVLDRLDSLAGSWAVLLPTRVYRAAIAHLLDTAIATLTSSVLAATRLPRGVAAACAHALGLAVQAAPLLVAGDEADSTASGSAVSAASMRLSPAALQALLPHLARAARVQKLLEAIAGGGILALDSALRSGPQGELCVPVSDTAGPLSRVEAACIVRAAEPISASTTRPERSESIRAALLADLQ